jgi:hypothetical protein
MSRYAQNRADLVQAFQEIHGRDPSLEEAQIIQSIGEAETGFGTGWGSDPAKGAGSHNIGAVQGTGSAGYFEHGDSNQRVSPPVHYTTKFKKYYSDVEGVADVVRFVTTNRPLVWEYIKNGDYMGAGIQMGLPPIYHQTPGEVYGAALLRCGTRIASALKEPLVSAKNTSIGGYTQVLITGLAAVGTYYAVTKYLG